MKFSLGLVCAVSALVPIAQGQTAPTGNRAPLAPNAFHALPPGSVKPAGWLRQQLRMQADSLAAHLHEIRPEGGALYLDGLLPLAYLMDDAALIAKARGFIDYTLTHQRPDGALPAPEAAGKPATDWWPDMVTLKILTQFEEATGDRRIVPAMQKYFAWQAAQLEARPLTERAQYRWGDELASLLWLYNRTGDPTLLDLARRIAAQGFDWKTLYSDFPFRNKTSKSEANAQNQGVNNAIAIRTEALRSLMAAAPEERAAANKAIGRMPAQLDASHGQPNGAFSADQHLAGLDPSQGCELSAIVEELRSLEEAIAVSGDQSLVNRLERIAFNALPAAFSKDMRTVQATQQANQVLVSNAPRDWTTAENQANLFGSGFGAPEIQRGWPEFAASLWMATRDGLAALVYAPADVRTRIGETPVHLSVETRYPFEEDIVIHVETGAPVTFPLQLRIPGWTSNVLVRVNGAAQRDITFGAFFRIDREWRTGDTIVVKFPMPVLVWRSYRNSAVITRGPLVYSLQIGEKWKKPPDRGKASDWEVYPSTPWNFALALSDRDPQDSFTVVVRPMGNQPFSTEGTPVALAAHGFRVGDWKLVNNSAGAVPQSPVKVQGAAEPITLIPYGAAKLRITEFPVAPRK